MAFRISFSFNDGNDSSHTLPFDAKPAGLAEVVLDLSKKVEGGIECHPWGSEGCGRLD